MLSGLLLALKAGAFAQGLIYLDNVNNTSQSPSAAANGLFWLSTGGAPELLNQDFNASFYGGVSANNLALLGIFLLSDGTAAHDNPFPGIFIDPSGNSYPIQGAFTSAFFRIQAWTGNFNSYAAAASAGAPTAQSPVFLNPVDILPGSPPDLVNMPAIVLGVPEPSTFVLAGLGGLWILLLCGRRKSTHEQAGV